MAERTKFLAHGENEAGETHELGAHLVGVAQRAAGYAASFDASQEAKVAGLLHDLGKFRDEFQRYLRKERSGSHDTHHAVYGAACAFEKEWAAAAFAVAGHHAGLHDLDQLQSLVNAPKYDAASQLPALRRRLERDVTPLPRSIPLPPFVEQDATSLEFYVRMIFSCLVDADRLDTESHYTGQARQIVRLRDVCEEVLDRLFVERSSKSRSGTINEIRHRIFDLCVEKAKQPPGFFTLTAPTGAGKTLSGMAFALAHAKAHNLDRVIVVIPYLSIIEQNAAEYRRIFDPEGSGLVVEHHSAVPAPDDEEEHEPTPSELAAENWDAPIIVTTSVQFIESLFASSPSKCRKLHNVANSVIVLDEVQTLPTHLLSPLLSVLRELKEKYRVSFLFMTATQPAFRRGPTLPEGFDAAEVTEITDDTQHVFAVLRRVRYREEGVLDWAALANRMAELPQALCVVNVRKHAFTLWEEVRSLLPEAERDSLFHLSSAMCPEHRLDVLGQIDNPREGSIRRRLLAGQPCRVVATQLVEAGVDVDFPVVFRAMGPLDSIVQAGGRCNREGRLLDEDGCPTLGQVILFTPQEHVLPPGIYKTAANHAVLFINQIDLESLGLDPDIFGHYFSGLFQLVSTDHAGARECPIQEDRQHLRFREVSRKARVIREDGVPVVVPYKRGKELIRQIRDRPLIQDKPRFGRGDMRRLQRFMVNVRRRDFDYMQHVGLVLPLLPNLNVFVLEEGCYHERLGLLLNERPVEDLCGV